MVFEDVIIFKDQKITTFFICLISNYQSNSLP